MVIIVFMEPFFSIFSQFDQNLCLFSTKHNLCFLSYHIIHFSSIITWHNVVLCIPIYEVLLNMFKNHVYFYNLI